MPKDILDKVRLIDDIPFDYEAETDIESDFEIDVPNVDDEIKVLDDPLTRAQNLDVTDNASPSSSTGIVSSDANYFSNQTNSDQQGSQVPAPTSSSSSITSLPSPTTNIRRKWRKKIVTIPDSTFCDYTLTQPFYSTALDAFLDFFDKTLVDKIHYETNLYCTQKNKTGNITKNEIYVFLGINIIMGYNKLPSLDEFRWMSYWMTLLDEFG